jgi:hypothetical protein
LTFEGEHVANPLVGKSDPKDQPKDQPKETTKQKVGDFLGGVSSGMSAAEAKNASARAATTADLQANTRSAPGPSYTPSVPIPDFSKASPATFHKGGTVKKGGIALVKKGELYMPPAKVAQLKKDIVRLMDKSFGR